MSGVDIVRPDGLNNRDDFEKFEKSYSNDENSQQTVARMAVQWGHLDLLKYALERESRLGDSQLWTLLDEAIKYGHLETVKYLIGNHQADKYDDKSRYRWEVIRRGIIYGHLDIVKYFVEEGMKKNMQPDLTHTYHEFRTLLFEAAEHGRTDIITYLTKKKKVYLTWIDGEKENILFKALRKENLDFIKHILDEEKVKIDINWKNDKGYTLVHLAVINYKSMKNAEKILVYLTREKHASLDIPLRKQRVTPLFYAFTRQFPLSMIKCMIKNGANLDKQDIYGHTALHLALFGHVDNGLEIFEYLCKHGANVNLENLRGKTPMTIVLEKLPRESRMLEAFKLLIEHGVNLNSSDKRGNHFVHIAAIQNNLNFLDYLVREKQVDVNTPRETDNITPLHWAAFRSHYEICKYLIEHGAKVDLKNQRNETPFDMSLKQKKSYEEKNTTEVWKLLLENGANANWTDEKGNELVHFAVTRSNKRFLDYLVRDRQVDINAPRATDGWTPLHCAVFQSDVEICKYLIEHGARVNQKDKNDQPPSDTVLKNPNFSWENLNIADTYLLFIDYGARINLTDKDGNQLVHAAAHQGRKSILEFLIQRKGKGFDINAPRESDSWTPLHLTAFACNSEICQYLLENGACVDQKDKTDRTPLDVVSMNIKWKRRRNQKLIETYKVLIEHGASVNGKELVHNAVLYNETSFLKYLINDEKVNINTPRKEDHWTPLHCAVNENNLEICQYLIKHGARVNEKDRIGREALNLVSKRYSPQDFSFYYRIYDLENPTTTEICKLLIEHGADVNSTNESGNQLVHDAAWYNRKNLLEYLIDHKLVDINTPRKKDGLTPLHCAAHQKHYEICKYLVEHGADIHAKNNDGNIPLQETWYPRVRDLLRDVSNTTRNRRNAMNHFLTLPQNPTHECRHESIADSVNRHTKIFPSYDSSFQLQNFFHHISLMMRYFVGGSSNLSRIPQLPQSSSEILRSRMDPIAVNAVNYFTNVTDA